jgi:hypothetical protein
MPRFRFILLIFSALVTVHAQEQKAEDTSRVSDDVQWERLLETIAQDKEGSQMDEEISRLEDHPLNMNTASAEELHHIPAMTNLIASRIIARRKHAYYVAMDELLTIEGMTPELFSFIRLYGTVRERKEQSDYAGSFISRTSNEIEKRRGFLNGEYAGSPTKSLNRLHVLYDAIEVGVLTEKDPGERSFASFSNAYASMSISALSMQLLVGDYKLEAAEGLVFWNDFSFSKGSDVISPIRKNGNGIHPCLSTDENSFLRGIATSVNLNFLYIQLLYSNKLINATVDSLGQISSLYKSGLFRTENELHKEHSTRETMIGYRAVAHIVDGFKYGWTGYRTWFANPFIQKGMNNECTSELWMQSMDVSYTNRTFDLFSELAVDRTKTVAVISGITYEPLQTLALTLLARKYPSSFQSIHGNAFGESGNNVQNENGVYVGIRLQPIHWLWISMYYDQYEHPQPTQFMPTPTHGNDFLALADCQITKQYTLSFRFKRKDSPSTIDNIDLYGRTIIQMIPRIQENYRLTSEFISSPFVRLKSRVEWMTVDYSGMKSGVSGLLLSQSLKWIVIPPLTILTRVAVFETDSYDSRLYEFEDDLAGAFSSPALYGKGLRWYFILRYKFFSKMHLTAKYSQTIKEDVKSIGTGLDEIEGNRQSTLSVQLDVRF